VIILCICLDPILTLLCDCHSIRIQGSVKQIMKVQLRDAGSGHGERQKYVREICLRTIVKLDKISPTVVHKGGVY
jgi:hypothetical protein